MIVDDDESIRHAVQSLLLTEEIESVAASGKQECLAYLEAGFRGVILMDIMMPGANGWETIREIERAGLLNGNLISMLTALEMPDYQMEGLQEVVLDYIVKPFEPETFISSIKRYLQMFEQIHSGC